MILLVGFLYDTHIQVLRYSFEPGFHMKKLASKRLSHPIEVSSTLPRIRPFMLSFGALLTSAFLIRCVTVSLLLVSPCLSLLHTASSLQARPPTTNRPCRLRGLLVRFSPWSRKPNVESVIKKQNILNELPFGKQAGGEAQAHGRANAE